MKVSVPVKMPVSRSEVRMSESKPTYKAIEVGRGMCFPRARNQVLGSIHQQPNSESSYVGE